MMEQISELIDTLPHQVWTADSDGNLTFVNKRVTDYAHEPRDVALGEGWYDLIHAEDLPLTIQKWAEAQATAQPYNALFRLKRWDGKYIWHLAKALPKFDADGRIIEWVGTTTDLSEREYEIQQLQRLTNLLDESQQIAKVGGWELDVASGYLFWTDETYRIFDTSPYEFNPNVDAGLDLYLPEAKEALSTALNEAITNGKDYDLELETYTTKGRKIDVRTTCRVTQRDNKTVKLTGIIQDISQQKRIYRDLEASNYALEKANKELTNIAHYDALTQLPNRTLLTVRLEQAMTSAKRRGTMVAVAYLDLDGFKYVNDVHSHNLGDDVLVTIAGRLSDAMRESDTLAHIGGDEFVIVLTDLTNATGCDRSLTRLLEAVADPIIINEVLINVTVSIGVTIYPQDDLISDQLLRHAGQAMFIAKQAGKNRTHYFDIEKDTKIKNLHEELQAIKSALRQDEFVLHYQPKVNMSSGKIVGAEALIRWEHPEQGTLSPAHFLPLIEEDELSIEVGEWVIHTALSQIESWQHTGINLPVSVNVGALQLIQDNFIDRLQVILNRFPDVDPSQLELEILETNGLNDMNHVSHVIRTCNQLGVNFSLDDFGTGYSSLTYLKRLPAQFLKIDQSFVRDMLDDPEDMAIVKGIIGLADAFGIEVIAEGVETDEQIRVLLACGCELAQGFGFARPMPATELPVWINAWELKNTGKAPD